MLRAFKTSEEGIAAVEFALVVPIMIALFFASVEVSNILIVDRKVTTATAAIADLIAQDVEITDAEMADIFAVGAALLAPFDSTEFSVTVSSVVDDGGDTRIDWAEDFQGGAATGTAVDLPSGTLTDGASVVVVEVEYIHNTVVGYFLADSVTLTDRFYARPRRTPWVSRTD